MTSIKRQLRPIKFKEQKLNKSKGILDDFAVRKVLETIELNAMNGNFSNDLTVGNIIRGGQLIIDDNISINEDTISSVSTDLIIDTSGDKIEFQHHTDPKLEINSTKNINKQDTDVEGGLNVSGEMEGSRMLLCFGSTKGSTGGAVCYLKMADGTACSASKGFVMPRAGSIVGMSVGYYVSSVTFSGNFRSYIQVNGLTVYPVDDFVNSTGQKNHYNTQDREIDKFNAGDRIGVKVDALYAGGYIDVVLLIEVQFDT